MGENGKGIILQITGSLLLPLNMALICISFQSIGYSADLRDDPLSRVMPLLWVFQKNALSAVALCVCLVQSCCQVFCRAARCSKGIWRSFYLCSQDSLCVSTFESVLWSLHSHHSRTMFRVFCHRWDSSWPSFDETIPVDINWSSKK